MSKHDVERLPAACGLTCPQRLGQYWQLVRGDRPIGSLLLLWPTWWALWLAADGLPPLWTLFVFTAGVWLTRSAGCVINDYADRWLDPHVERTKSRPLATGAVSGREALWVFVVLMLVAFALVFTLNWLTVLLSVPGVFLAASYPYLKRHTHLPQVYLGMAFGWGIPMAFAAVQGSVPVLGWLLYAANILWATASRHLVRHGRPRRRHPHGQQIHRHPVRQIRSGRARHLVCADVRSPGLGRPAR